MEFDTTSTICRTHLVLIYVFVLSNEIVEKNRNIFRLTEYVYIYQGWQKPTFFNFEPWVWVYGFLN